MNNQDFRESVYEIAFGDDAINNDYSDSEVLKTLHSYAEDSFKFEEIGIDRINEVIKILLDDCQIQYDSLDEYDDVKWDCYDKESWQRMIILLNKLRQLTKDIKWVESTQLNY